MPRPILVFILYNYPKTLRGQRKLRKEAKEFLLEKRLWKFLSVIHDEKKVYITQHQSRFTNHQHHLQIVSWLKNKSVSWHFMTTCLNKQ